MGSEPFLDKSFQPVLLNKAYAHALRDCIGIIDDMASSIDVDNRSQMLNIITTSIGTKFTHRFGDLMAELALDAVKCVTVELSNGQRDIDIKKYVKIEKIPGGAIEDCRVLKGVMFNKDVVNPGRMRRKIVNPRILLLDCALEYKKGENTIQVEMTKEDDFASLLKIEEEWAQKTCANIVLFKPDVVITEKGLSDLVAYYLQKAGISAIRRIRKTDNNRMAKASGATIVHRPEEIRERDIGNRAGLFQVQKIGDDFFSFTVDCQEPKACSIILRGASKDLLNEVERNLGDAMSVVRSVVMDPKLLPSGGAVEIEVSKRLAYKSHEIKDMGRWPYRAIGVALEIIPRTLAQNCGSSVIRTLTKLRMKHLEPEGSTWGVNGHTGLVVDMKSLGAWEPRSVKVQAIKTAVEAACMMLRIDDIITGIGKRDTKENLKGGEDDCNNQCIESDSY